MFRVIHLHALCPSLLEEVEQQPLSIHHLHDVPYIQRTGGGHQHQCFPRVHCFYYMLLVGGEKKIGGGGVILDKPRVTADENSSHHSHVSIVNF